MKKELLIPVGSMDSLYQAIHHGADAVYLGGKDYGARKYANNFSRDEMIAAIQLCHLYKVKIYVTVNTLIYEEEVSSFLDYVIFLYQHHVDAVIMQDIGMIELVHATCPNLVIHASTQMHNHNREGILHLKNLGVKRVVLARELSLEEIESIDVDIEKEVFIHGALCICYSGCCLFSSMVGGRSGNRGECAGSCRLPYEFYEDDKKISTNGDYLLSPKELNTVPLFPKLMKSHITSFKIEGRMKSPSYVGFITKFYRSLMDHFSDSCVSVVSEKTRKELESLFTRGFTTGFLGSSSLSELMNISSPNHLGTRLGKVKGVTCSKIQILLEYDLTQGDGIRFLSSGTGMIVNKLYDNKGNLIHGAKKGSLVFVDNKVSLHTKDDVSKTYDITLTEQLNHYDEKKIPLQVRVFSYVGKPLRVLFSNGEVFCEQEAGIVEKAKSTPVSLEDMKRQLSKFGNTCFTMGDFVYEGDESVFFPLRYLSELRRNLACQMRELLSGLKYDTPILDPMFSLSSYKASSCFQLVVSVFREEQLLEVSKYPVDAIYVKDRELYQKYKHRIPHLYYQMEQVMSSFDSFQNEFLVARELGSFSKYAKENEVVIDYTLNVTNSYSIYHFLKYGARSICLSPELTIEQIKKIVNSFQRQFSFLPPLEFVAYGRIQLMIMKYCPIRYLLKRDSASCHLCKEDHSYFLKDRKNEYYPILTSHELTSIFHYKPLDLFSQLSSYLSLGLLRVRLDFTVEHQEEVSCVLKRYYEFLSSFSYSL